MKKKILCIWYIIACVVMILGFSACHAHTVLDKWENDANGHAHTFLDKWENDANYHWHEATCEHTGEKGNLATHLDEDNDGVCDVCEYNPINVNVDGTYYLCENDILDEYLYVVFKDGKWTDDEEYSGKYTIVGNKVKLFLSLENNEIELEEGTVSGDDIVFSALGTYRKGEDINSKPKEKTLSYALSEDKTYYIVKGIGGLTGDITIPKEWKRKPVKEIAENAFANCDTITSVTIADGIETLGQKAFYKCTELITVVIGESISSIQVGTFYECKKLESITLSASLKSIQKKAFYYCLNLKDVYFNGTISNWANIDFYQNGSEYSNPIHDGTIYGMDGYSKYPDRNLYIDGNNTTEIEITETQYISPYAFFGWGNLEKVTIGGSIKEIGERAFAGCKNLTTILCIGNKLKEIGIRAFEGTKISSLTLPDSVTKINQHAFNNCNNMQTVVIGDGVTYIGEGAFMGCDLITDLTIGKSVIEICESAFYSCDSLQSVTIPSSVIYIGQDAFFGCGLDMAIFQNASGWEILKIEGYVSIENLADTAEAAKLLSTSVLEQGLSEYNWERTALHYKLSGDGSYYIVSNKGRSCRSEIVIPEYYNEKPVRVLADYAFYECTNLTSITIPDSVTSIGHNAFAKCTNLTSITIPDSVTSIDRYAFFQCTSLTSITIPDGVTSIGEGAFSCCYFLTSITIPDSVTSIGEGAFFSCTHLTSIYYLGNIADWCKGDGLTAIRGSGDTDIYINGENIREKTEIVIPDGVTSIGGSAFYNWYNLTSITIPDSVTSIGSWAFSRCTNLTSITIPDSVTSIDSYAFSGCQDLETILFTGTKEQWEAIDKSNRWNDSIENCTICCTDGTIVYSS